jgi:anaerobic selenocysteine-containing dehydrogenase
LAGKIEISPEDGEHLDVNTDDSVIVRSRFGSLTREIRLKEGLGSRQIFVPTGYNDNDAMNLFELSDMTTPGSSGWKTCQVRIEKA